MIETMRRAYCDRARYLGDADFVKIPRLPDQQGIRQQAGPIDRPQPRRRRSADLAKDIPLTGEGDSTTHFSVIDGDGMAVSATPTRWNAVTARASWSREPASCSTTR